MITVFTPTYNRKYLINNLYQSLLKQTDKNFEWVVVDDGSIDDTDKFFSELLSQELPFNIVYIKQNNGGKHRAINRGVKFVTENRENDLFFIVDSDDYLVDNAIEKLYEWKNTLDNSKKWAGISGLKGYSKQNYIGGAGKEKFFTDAKNTERRKYELEGDKAEAYFVDVLKKYPFPEIDGENFITEEVVWNAIAADSYYIRWFNEVIYICEYMADGLTQNIKSKLENNPKGVLLWARQELKIHKNNLRKISSAINVYYEIVFKNKNKREIATDLEISLFKLKTNIFIKKIYKKFKNDR